MPLMTKPTRHPKSGIYRVRLTVPADLRDTAQRLYGKRREFIHNLETKDARIAAASAPAALADLLAKLETVRAAHTGQGRPLSQREVRAIAGQWYKARVAEHEDNPGEPERWSAMQSVIADDLDPDDHDLAGYEPTADDLARAGHLIAGQGIAADPASVRAVAIALHEASFAHAALMERRAGGDYGPDQIAATFPAMPTPVPAAATPAASARTDQKVTITNLVRGWGRDHGYDPDSPRVARNYYDRSRTAARLAAFLGHEDTSRVTKADAVRWKEHEQANKKASSVGNDISEMSAVWKWGIANGKVTLNPFAGLLPPKKARDRKATKRPYTTEEAALILAAARQEKGTLRWFPWVLCLTGARLSEISQAVKEDIIERDGVPFIRLHDDDNDDRAADEAPRSVKNEASIRNVPIHPALVAEGFLKYVAALPARSSLWPDIKPDKVFGSRGVTVQKGVSKWLRGKVGITDRKLSPAHSWRHWWIDQARAAELHPEVRDAITGHADNRNESRRYGKGWREQPARLADGMAKIRPPLP